MHNHLKVLSILFIIGGVMGIIGAMLIMLIFLIGPIIEGDPEAFMIVGSIGSFFALLILVTTIPGLIVGIGLIKRKPWARIIGIIVGAFSLLNVPIGTALGIYALWVLLQPETVLLFTPVPQHQTVPPGDGA